MEKEYDKIYNCMPIDEYYNYCFEKLPYRSVKFYNTNYNFERLSNHTVINFSDHKNFTRMIEWKNFPNCKNISKNTTTITYEEPCDYENNNMERYYPVKDANGENFKLYKKYKKIDNNKVTFIGRCGMYVYIDMDQAISSSLSLSNKMILS